MNTPTTTEASTHSHFTGTTVLTLASGAGFAVASIYYAQPILPLMQKDLALSVEQVGWVPTLTQFGYALGLFFLVPLGDRHDRRDIIGIKSLLLALVLLLCSLSGGVYSVLLTSLMIGIGATLAQDIVPSAAILAPASRQGKAVGTVMTGLLLGILLSRTFSGFVAEHFGWRAMYQIAAVVVVISGIALRRQLPRFERHSSLSYPALLRSMGHLFGRYPTLRYAAFAQGMLSIGFSAFWSTLALMLSQRFELGSDIAGAFGLAGAAGAIAAPLAGGLSDRLGPARVTQFGTALVSLAFATMFALPWLGMAGQLLLIAISTIVFDFGLQMSLVAHQAMVYRLDPAARGRLNAVFFTSVFIGMALGSLLGSLVFARSGWPGVVWVATLSAVVSFSLRLKAARHH
ncbi:MFS transporter [Gallaecimonas mangrovi]|uniref:MFS transporter n=1 Tax=Gallaecimonas mangrovi TaxID=2291597 RepID=UPI000E1FCF65|nr:MFS transporter [Gallaecimonas mangrovi]